jgi:SAM-dependent methyltransferase
VRLLRRLLTLGLVFWAVASAAALIFVRLWLRERHGRGGPIPASQAGTLLHPLRRRIHPPKEMLAWFGVQAGQTVLELGPGPGYFTIEAGRCAGEEGRVLCVDIQREMLDALRARLRAHGIANAHPVLGDATRLPLKDGSVDLAYLVTVLGEVPDRPAALAELRRVLRPGGALAFAETLTDPDYVFRDTLRDLCRSAGFAFDGERRLLLGYMMRFRKPGETPSSDPPARRTGERPPRSQRAS